MTDRIPLIVNAGAAQIQELPAGDNISIAGNITAQYFIGNGSQLTGISGGSSNYNNSNVATFLASFGSNVVSTTGNVTAGNIISNRISAPDGNGSVLINASGLIGATAGFNFDTAGNTLYVPTGTFRGNLSTGSNAIYAGTQSFTLLGSNVTAQFTGNVESYNQTNFQNTSAANTASGDHIITANNGNDTTHFIDLGMTSSTWDGSQTNVLEGLTPNNGYLYVQDGNLTLGTRTGNTSYAWKFDTDGKLTLPGNTGPYNGSLASFDNGTLIVLTSQANNIVRVQAAGSDAEPVADITVSGSSDEIDRVGINTYNPDTETLWSWRFNTSGDLAMAGGNVFLGYDTNGPVIVSINDYGGFKAAANRADTDTNFISVSESSINLRTSGNNSDINIAAGDDVRIAGGDKVSAPQSRGGDIFITSGQGGDDGGSQAGYGGYVEINGGQGGNAVNGGAGDGGDIRLSGGNGGAADVGNSLPAGSGGRTIILGGQAGDNNGEPSLNSPGGNIELYGGTGTWDVGNNRPGGQAGDVGLYGGNWGYNFVPTGNISIGTYDGDTFYNWKFDNTGNTYFPLLSTQRGDNPSGTIYGYTLRMGDGQQEAVIATPDGVPGNEYSQRLVINPGAGNNYGEGGDIYLWAGRGGDGSGSGGDIKIRGGQGGANTSGGTGGAGGYIRMEAGDSAAAGGNAGFIEITAGQAQSGEVGGYVRITGGQGATGGGNANITGGYAQNGSGGAVNIVGGGSNDGLANYGNVTVQSGSTTWTFDNTGNLRLPNNSIINETSVAVPGGGADAMALIPANGIDADQKLLVYPTIVGDNNHLHLTSGNLWNTELFLGNDDLYVKLANTGNIIINSNDNGGNTAQWNFGTDGNLTTPGSGGDLVLTGGNITGANVVNANILVGALANSTGRFTLLSDNSLLSGTVASPQNFKVSDAYTPDIDLRNASGTGVYTQGANLTIRTQGTYNWNFTNTGDLTTQGNITASGSFISTPVPYANLTAVAGARAFINNGNLVAAGNFGAQVIGGGSNTVPAWSDGVNWYIG